MLFLLLLSHFYDTNYTISINIMRHMNEFNLSNQEISRQVARGLKRRGWSLRSCVGHYNNKRMLHARYKLQPELNKDFLLRVKNNNFDIANERVALLCDFLEIRLDGRSAPQHRLQKEFDRVESLLDKNPQLASHVSDLLNSITDLANNAGGVK